MQCAFLPLQDITIVLIKLRYYTNTSLRHLVEILIITSRGYFIWGAWNPVSMIKLIKTDFSRVVQSRCASILNPASVIHVVLSHTTMCWWWQQVMTRRSFFRPQLKNFWVLLRTRWVVLFSRRVFEWDLILCSSTFSESGCLLESTFISICGLVTASTWVWNEVIWPERWG